MIIKILLGILIGILSSGTGLGGGFFVVPFLIYMGKVAKISVGTSFLYVFFVAISSLIAHIRLGNVDYRTGLILAAGGIWGAQVGPHLLTYVPDLIFKRVFGVMMLSVGAWLLASV